MIANGGSVSAATMRAVSKFCKDIDATSGLRAAILRLSLFCGNNLEACLVPLYRAGSRTGAVIGNATDFNTNFVSGDYNETGASGGLTGNGSNKHLLCGSVLASVDRANSHMMVYGSSLNSPSTGDRSVIGAAGPSLTGVTLIATRDGANQAIIRYFSSNTTAGTPWVDGTEIGSGFADGCLLGAAVSATDLRMYRNGSQIGSTRTLDRGSGAQTSVSMAVFAININNSIVDYSAPRLRAYSVGLGMTASQVSAYYTAMQAFQTSLARNV